MTSLVRRGHATLASAAIALAVTAAVPALAADAPPDVVVGLGDSYAAGDGAGSYDTPGDPCRRSPRSWQRQLALPDAPQAARSHVACSGATTADVRGGQLSSLSSSTRVVALSVGGNDAFFTPALTACARSATCADEALTDAAGKQLLPAPLRDSLPRHVATVVAQAMTDTLTDIHAQAPQATILWTGYPDVLGAAHTGDAACLSLSTTRTDLAGPATRQLLSQFRDDLEEAQLAAAKAAAGVGVDVVFVPVKSTFEGHSVCRPQATGQPWINSLSAAALSSGSKTAFHPNADGQAAYLAAAQAALDEHLRPATTSPTTAPAPIPSDSTPGQTSRPDSTPPPDTRVRTRTGVVTTVTVTVRLSADGQPAHSVQVS